jgi:ketosteroid isomerase-like protein
MSQENVEIVERAIAVYGRRDEALERSLFDPEIETWESSELPGEFVGKGYDNLVRGRETVLDSFEEWSLEAERFFDLGDRVLVFTRFRARGKSSGLTLDAPMAHLLTVRGRRVVKWCLFGDRGEALEAVGLSE